MLRTAGNGLVRGLLGVIGLGGKSRSSSTKKNSGSDEELYLLITS
jgi:hypothetical protein